MNNRRHRLSRSRKARAQFKRRRGWIVCVLACLLAACGGGSGKPTVTIYTSIYESVISDLEPILAEQFPEIEVEWFQKGSEEIATKINAEIAAGRINADIIMTSDPFWYEELKRAGHLLAYESAGAAGVPTELKDPDGAYVTVRVPVMVMAVNGDKVPEADRPRTFEELTTEKWAGRVAMGNPLQSGSTFTAVAALSAKYGWKFFEGLRRNEAISAGGNSSVLNRVVTGERDVGIILLENLLQARADNPDTPAQIVYPEDGSILVPSPIAIMSATGEAESAKQIYDFMLSEDGQRAIIAGQMYSPITGSNPPAGARSWGEIYSQTLVPWSPDYLEQTLERRDEIKNEFNRIMFE